MHEFITLCRSPDYHAKTMHARTLPHLYKDETWDDGVAAQGVVRRHLVSCRETNVLRIHCRVTLQRQKHQVSAAII